MKIFNKSQREVLFSHGQFLFAVAVGKKGNMECLKILSNGLRTILQYSGSVQVEFPNS